MKKVSTVYKKASTVKKKSSNQTLRPGKKLQTLTEKASTVYEKSFNRLPATEKPWLQPAVVSKTHRRSIAARPWWLAHPAAPAMESGAPSCGRPMAMSGRSCALLPAPESHGGISLARGKEREMEGMGMTEEEDKREQVEKKIRKG